MGSMDICDTLLEFVGDEWSCQTGPHDLVSFSWLFKGGSMAVKMISEGVIKILIM